MVAFECNMFGSWRKFNSGSHFITGMVVFMDLANELGFLYEERK